MSNRESHRVKLVVGWDRLDGKVAELAHKYLLSELERLHDQLKRGYVAGSVKRLVKCCKLNGGEYLEEIRIHHKGWNDRGRRKTDWSQVFQFVLGLRQLLRSVPEEMKPWFEYDLGPSHMPWVFHNGFGEDRPTDVFARPGADVESVKLNRAIRIDDPVAKFSNFLVGKKRAITYVESDEFLLVGRPWAVKRFKLGLAAIERATPGKYPFNPLDGALGYYGFPMEDQLLVMYRDTTGQLRNIPGTGHVCYRDGLSKHVLTGDHESLDLGLTYSHTLINADHY